VPRVPRGSAAGQENAPVHAVTAASYRNDSGRLAYKLGYRPITIAQILTRISRTYLLGKCRRGSWCSTMPSEFTVPLISTERQARGGSHSALGIWESFREDANPGWKPPPRVFCHAEWGPMREHNFFGRQSEVRRPAREWRPSEVFGPMQGYELCDHTVWHAAGLDKFPGTPVVARSRISRNAMGSTPAVPLATRSAQFLAAAVWAHLAKNRPSLGTGSFGPIGREPDRSHYSSKRTRCSKVSGRPTRSPL